MSISARISKLKQLNVFNILILFVIAPLLLDFSNHILVFFAGMFEFSLSGFQLFPVFELIFFNQCIQSNCKLFFTEHLRATASAFIVKLDYLLLYWFFNWIIFLTSGTLYRILRMSPLLLYSMERTLRSYYNTTIKKKCVIRYFI